MMTGTARRIAAGIAAAALCLCTLPAFAVIKRIYPLADVIADADRIYSGKIESRDAKAHRVTLKSLTAQKGAAPTVPMVIHTAGGDTAAQTPILEARLSPGRTVVFFGKTGRFSIGYVEGTWFRITEPAGSQPWQLVHLEPYLRRTYHGTSADLGKAITAVIAGKEKAPAPDPTAEPGVGK